MDHFRVFYFTQQNKAILQYMYQKVIKWKMDKEKNIHFDEHVSQY